ncbi:nitroreductase [Bacillus sp. AFS076308]|uniref:nitroreductase family protein n=1 Tax=unclassified Bacillus (in: firmicutes) TaxID=185979 RepID=UPI000BF48DAF|nr:MULTISPECIES: nitroreductase [unclassified Bacillus (in: firmicutes)]PFO04772.1 nitroreductase [Bacillus sp. AFS076308]PGV49786.1 nitroreductase [Bacillus sp. AFS037270]
MIEVIRSRRNIKKFKPDEVKEEDLMTWLQAASMAPNHRMTEPWEILFLGKETREKLNHKTNFGKAPVVMAVLSKKGMTQIELIENALATACFIQNFNLAAWADGVGSFWSSIGASERNREILGVPDGYEVIGVLGVGYPEIIPEPKPRKPIAEKIKRLP